MRNPVLSGHNLLNAEWLAEEIALLIHEEREGIILAEALIPAIRAAYKAFEEKVADSEGLSAKREKVVSMMRLTLTNEAGQVLGTWDVTAEGGPEVDYEGLGYELARTSGQRNLGAAIARSVRAGYKKEQEKAQTP
jgi:hypothetical protein